MDAAGYKHVVIALIFPKYISDPFEEANSRLLLETDAGAGAEDPDEYVPTNLLGPQYARWPVIQPDARHSQHRAVGEQRNGRHRGRQPGAQGHSAR